MNIGIMPCPWRGQPFCSIHEAPRLGLTTWSQTELGAKVELPWAVAVCCTAQPEEDTGTIYLPSFLQHEISWSLQGQVGTVVLFPTWWR